MTPTDQADPDVAQAKTFLGVLLAEIDLLSGRIETAEVQARAADPVDHGEGQSLRADAQKLRLSCTRCTDWWIGWRSGFPPHSTLEPVCYFVLQNLIL